MTGRLGRPAGGLPPPRAAGIPEIAHLCGVKSHSTAPVPRSPGRGPCGAVRSLWVDSRIFSDSSVPAVARASRIAPTRVATMGRSSSASVDIHAANSWTPAAYVSRTSRLWPREPWPLRIRRWGNRCPAGHGARPTGRSRRERRVRWRDRRGPCRATPEVGQGPRNGATDSAWLHPSLHRLMCPRHQQATPDLRLTSTVHTQGVSELAAAHHTHQRLLQHPRAATAWTTPRAITRPTGSEPCGTRCHGPGSSQRGQAGPPCPAAAAARTSCGVELVGVAAAPLHPLSGVHREVAGRGSGVSDEWGNRAGRRPMTTA
ncbi:hypothetical protein SAURM35S_05726 [Streptomyces aurantiogriseus]